MQTFDPAEQTWLVVPLYNEAQVVAEVIANARKTFPNVVCVDDGSRDDSAAQARSAGAIVVSHPLNLGQGAALQTGITYVLTRTNARYIATFDSDGQHSTDDVMAMVRRAHDEDLAIVLGSRFLEGTADTGTLKRIVLRTAAWVGSKTSGMKLTDAHNGLRLLRRDAAESWICTKTGWLTLAKLFVSLAPVAYLGLSSRYTLSTPIIRVLRASPCGTALTSSSI